MARTLSAVVTATLKDASGNVRSSLPRSEMTHSVTLGGGMVEFVVAKAVTDQQLDLGALSGIRFLALYTDRALVVQLDNGTTGTEIDVAAGGAFVVTRGSDITAVYLTNESATDDANVTVLMGK